MALTHIADACALLAYFGEVSPAMSQAGLTAMAGDVLVSPVSIWELTRKASLGKLAPLPSQNGSFGLYLQATGFRTAELTWADAEASNNLPPHHRDPMDRMLIATATRLGLPIITSDRLFTAYGVKTVW